MKIITWDRDKGVAEFGGMNFTITCKIRNELNGQRKLHTKGEVVNTVVQGQTGPPYMPRPFPKGEWEITGIEPSKDKDYFPLKIRTTAHQLVETWSLDSQGGYDKPAGKKVDDGGYHLHFCESSQTTLGCGRIKNFNEAIMLAALILLSLDKQEPVFLKVI